MIRSRSNGRRADVHPLVLSILAAVTLVGALPGGAAAQAEARAHPQPGTTTAAEVRDELLGQFEASMRKFIALAEAMPAESYTWSPGEGVMEVGHVYMHVARYNYMYPSANMGLALPGGVALDGMEEVRDRDAVLRALRQSHAWVRDAVAGMSAPELAAGTRLYGRDLERWAVLVQLVAHMNEHLGQSIAYARMNGVVPPWSR